MCRKKIEETDDRHIRVVRTATDVLYSDIDNYADNKVSTTKFTCISFFPMALAMQYKRLANVYFTYCFFIMLIGNYTGCWQSITPWTLLMTLVLIMGISMIILGIDDCQRERQDRITNSQSCRVVRPSSVATPCTEEMTWEELKVGDLVLLANDDFAPCDVVPLCSSNELGLFYVKTTNLDGETNLKVGNVRVPIQNVFNKKMVSVTKEHGVAIAAGATTAPQALHVAMATATEHDFDVVVEPPDVSLNSFRGSVEVSQLPRLLDKLSLKSSVLLSCLFEKKKKKNRMPLCL